MGSEGWLPKQDNLAHLMEEHFNWIERIDYISSASVPIIKIVTKDSDFEVKVDITFGDQTHKGSDCVALGKFFCLNLHTYSPTIYS